MVRSESQAHYKHSTIISFFHLSLPIVVVFVAISVLSHHVLSAGIVHIFSAHFQGVQREGRSSCWSCLKIYSLMHVSLEKGKVESEVLVCMISAFWK